LKYSFDTSAIIETWRRKYPPDIFPTLWTNIVEAIPTGEIRASETVLEDLKKQDDEIFSWAKSMDGLFVPIDEGIQRATSEILERCPGLVKEGSGRHGSDPWVIALARTNSACVVTEENLLDSPSRPKIPGVCRIFNIRCINILEFIREHGWIFS
jgi:hypothetical protein